MLAGKNLIDYTSLFSPYDFLKNDNIILRYFKIKFILNEINKIKYYFNAEIEARKIMSKKLSKYIAAFAYFFCKYYWSSCRNSKCKF